MSQAIDKPWEIELKAYVNNELVLRHEFPPGTLMNSQIAHNKASSFIQKNHKFTGLSLEANFKNENVYEVRFKADYPNTNIKPRREVD